MNNQTNINSKNNGKQNKGKLWKRLVLIGLLCLLIFGGLFGAFIFDFFYTKPSFKQEEKNPYAGKKLNILIVGYDSELNGRPRSDTMMLASFDLEENAVGIVSIPRDTRVEVPEKGLNRINSAYAYGGIELAVETVSNFLNVPIDYYVATNFDGFEAMIDTLGGIEIEVEEDMWYEDKAGGLTIDFSKGKQVLSGEDAVKYVRYRDEITADLGRIERQQKLINAAIDQFLTPGLLLKLPTLISQFNQSIETNMTINDMKNLAKLVQNINGSNIKTARIPGVAKRMKGVWYFLADEAGTRKMINDLIATKEYIDNNRCKVAVYNGNGVFGMASSVSHTLQLHGFKVDKVANAQTYDFENTFIYYTGEEPSHEIENLAKAMNGLIKPYAEFPYPSDEMTKFDAMVIVGKDYIG